MINTPYTHGYIQDDYLDLESIYNEESSDTLIHNSIIQKYGTHIVDGTYKSIINLLPREMQDEGNATNIKKILEIYSATASYVDNRNRRYGSLLDVYLMEGKYLDFLGIQFGVARTKTDISDEVYRDSILIQILKRRINSSVVELNDAIHNIILAKNLNVMEEKMIGGRLVPATIYLVGTGSDEDIFRVTRFLKELKPAGIRLLLSAFDFGTWQSVNQQFASWVNLGANDTTW